MGRIDFSFLGFLLFLILMVGGGMYTLANQNPRRLGHDPWNGTTTYSLKKANGDIVIYTVDSTGKILCSKETQ